MTRETFTKCYVESSKETLVEMLYDTIVEYEEELKTKQDAINSLSAELLTLKADMAARYEVKDKK